MLNYDRNDHILYIEQRMLRLCAMAGVSYETVTHDNYQEVSDALGLLSEKSFNYAQAELRSLYMQKYLIPFFDEVV